MYNPLEQFKITPIIRIYNEWLDLTITNSTIMMLISVLVILLITSRDNNIIVNKRERLFEILYLKIEEILLAMLGGKGKSKYIPLIKNIFLFILLNNIIGLVPYSFTTTSHIAITLTFSLSIIIAVTFLGFRIHSFSFFNLFIPSGLNKGFIKMLIPLIFLIEIISYLTRIISLSVRLTANMMSGHTLLKIIANFGLKYTTLAGQPYIFLLIPLVILIPVLLLELGVAFIQAYVFTLLTASYIKDAELLH